MKTIVKLHRGVGLELSDGPMPTVGLRDVLIKVKAASICGSDLPIYLWDDPWVRSTIKPGQIIGHEFCGIVVDRGDDVFEVAVGEFVTAEGHINCGKCSRCKNNEGHICLNLRLIGFDLPGAFAEFIVVPIGNVISLSKDLPLVIGAIQDPFGNAIHATSKISLTNKTVLITGCGPIGLMAISLARLAGARQIFATELSEYRINLATKMGANYAINPNKTNLKSLIVDKIGDEGGVDVFFEMSGNSNALKQGFKNLRNGGDAILLGLPKKPVPFDFSNDLITKCISIHGITGRIMFSTWDQAEKLLNPKQSHFLPKLLPVITHRLILEDFERGFELMRTGECGKVILFMDQESLEESQIKIT